MLLAIDTATKWMGLALYDGRMLHAELGWRSLNNHTVELAPSVADLLQRSGLDASDISGVAVAIGPGSYTGLRIGLGFAKGLALANKTHMIGVTTLDIQAAALKQADGQLTVVAEAGRTRVCAGVYEWKQGKGWQSDSQPIVENWENLLGSSEEPMTFAGEISPAAAKLIRASSKSFRQVSVAESVRRAGFLAEIGWSRLRRGWTDDASQLSPIYLRDPAGATSSSS